MSEQKSNLSDHSNMNDSDPIGKQSTHTANLNTPAASHRIILLSMLAMMLIFCVFGARSWNSYRYFMDAEQQELRVVELIGVIKYLDEVLTMSAYMAAATGDSQWEQRHKTFDPQLDAAITEATNLFPNPSMSKAAGKIDLANIKLIVIENKVFDLVRRQEREKAAMLLNGMEYTEQKRNYSNAVSELTVALWESIQNTITKYRRELFGFAIITAILGASTLFALGVMLQMHKRLIERKQAENNLQTERNRLDSIIGAMEDGLTIRNLEYEIIYQNKVVEDFFGDVRGKKCYQVFEGKDQVCDGCPVELAFEDDKSHTSVREVIMPSGETTFWENTANPIRDAGGKIIACLEIAKNITERKRAETDLENYKEKVLDAQRHAYIGSMGAIVAHQVNQPLTQINILLDRALDNPEAMSCNPDNIRDIRESLAQVKEATSIIRKFRQYSKDSTLEGTDNVNVSAVADRIITVLSERAKQAQIRMSAKGLRDLPEIEINETALEQIFLIISQNAIDAADGRKQNKLEITGEFADGNIELRFADDCCGIAPEDLDRIFEPFFSTKIKDKGMGLGLDIVQQILISCGGQIRVESHLGKGTTFYVTLPVSDSLGD